MRKLRVLSFIVALVLVLLLASPVLAATTATVTFTYTPTFVSISISPTTFTWNSLAGNSKILPSVVYVTNPDGGDTDLPTAGGATDAECQFTITNTSSVAIDITVVSANATGGSDPMNNNDTGAAGADTYGAKSYFSGQATAAWEIAKWTGSSVGLDGLGATTNVKCGIIFAPQTNAFSGATSSTIVTTWTASID